MLRCMVPPQLAEDDVVSEMEHLCAMEPFEGSQAVLSASLTAKRQKVKEEESALAVVEELADTTVVQEVEEPAIQPASPPKKNSKR